MRNQRKLSIFATTTFVLAALFAAGTAEAQTPPLAFGMDRSGYDLLTGAGLRPEHVQLWIGPWLFKSGWAHVDAQFETSAREGSVPVLQFYYWGGDISPTCLEKGCWSGSSGRWKDQADWGRLASDLVAHMKSKLLGKRAVIVLETEFNKNGMSRSETLDAALASKAKYFRTNYGAAQVAIGFGNWGYGDWGTFDRAVAAANYAGLQGMRASTRDSESSYLGVAQALLDGSRELERRFWKPVFIGDIALSSYTEPYWLEKQKQAIQRIMDVRSQLKDAGVVALVYRSGLDTPTATTAEYYGQAERHFGLAWASNKVGKPAMDAWKSGIRAERSGSTTVAPSSTSYASFGELETANYRSTGGASYHSQASATKFWNLWANGHVSHWFSLPGDGTYEVSVNAQGTKLQGTAPHMEVRLGGKPVVYADPGPYGWHDYVGRAWVAKGTHEVRIDFTNDAAGGGEDRNLWLDRVDIKKIG
ncbi:MAG TPA: carbohydrate-binding domain-containing protein [Candidatus Thermoplasmatota archaeon]|nr:carbohydrate-binding domain-containing protein [Candidatus Thermoplasmatota archaeon]